jgi:hypothetical protein
MEPMTHDDPRRHIHDQHDPTGPDETLAARANQRLLESMANLPALEQNRMAQQIALDENWELWKLGGFRFADSSVLWHSGSDWQALCAEEACARLRDQLKQPLEVRLLYDYEGNDGREKRSIAEARFEFQESPGRWRLVVEYEAYMDSPLYGLEADSSEELLELSLWNLHVDTPQPNQRWRLEQIALHPDWVELLHLSRAPD